MQSRSRTSQWKWVWTISVVGSSLNRWVLYYWSLLESINSLLAPWRLKTRTWRFSCWDRVWKGILVLEYIGVYSPRRWCCNWTSGICSSSWPQHCHSDSSTSRRHKWNSVTQMFVHHQTSAQHGRMQPALHFLLLTFLCHYFNFPLAKHSGQDLLTYRSETLDCWDCLLVMLLWQIWDICAYKT